MGAVHFLSATIFENRVDVRAQAVLEIVAIALLQAELVVVNDEKPIHRCIIRNFRCSEECALHCSGGL